jgi:far upstream element-binding protein
VKRAVVEVQQILYNPEQALRLKQQQLSMMGNSNPPDSLTIYGPGSSDTVTVDIEVPNSMVGLVIGKGGENIQRMQNASGAHMQIAKENEMRPGDTTRKIELRGSQSAVNELKRLVDEVVMNKKSGGMGMDKSMSGGGVPSDFQHAVILKIVVPNDKVGLIIGKGGLTVKGIQERTRSNVYIPPAADDDNPGVRTISIGAGNRECADACQLEVFQVLQANAQSNAAAQSNAQTAMHVQIPDDKIGLVIGKAGMTVKDIQNRCGVRIQIPHCPDPGTSHRTCSIVGTPQAQHIARYEIEAVLHTQIMSVSQVPPGVVIPTGGSGPVAPSTSAYGGSNWGQASGGYGGQSNYYGGQSYGGQSYGGMGAYGGYDANAYYSQYAATAAGTADPAATAAAAAAPTDPTAYYNDFWTYAAYYGEPAARQYYGAWSPPEGTQPPASMTAGASTEAGSAGSETTADGHHATNGSATTNSSSSVPDNSEQQPNGGSGGNEGAAVVDSSDPTVRRIRH